MWSHIIWSDMCLSVKAIIAVWKLKYLVKYLYFKHTAECYHLMFPLSAY